MMATLGISNDVINECLNHIQNDRMSRVYIRDRRETEQARAFDALGVKLALIASRRPLGPISWLGPDSHTEFSKRTKLP